MMCSRRCFMTFALAAAAHAQTLAHPGWRGNGIAAEAWWKHTAIVRFDPETTFAQAGAAMDAMSQAGVDTLLLPDLQPEPGAVLPFDERFGSEDDLDALLREASARRMHVLLSTPLLRLGGNSGEVRFWLTRGIAGFDVGTVRPAEMDTLHLLRAALDRSPGQRLLLVRLDTASGPKFVRAFRGPTLRLASVLEAENDAGPMPSVGAVEITNPATAPALHGLVLVYSASALDTETGREQVRRLLAAQVSHARARRDK